MATRTYLIHPSLFFSKGIEFAGWAADSPVNRRSLERFRSYYGCSPGVCSVLWDRICALCPRGYSFKHLLWALMFLKVYGTESVLVGKIGVDEDTYRDHMWPVVRAIASLKLQVVRYYYYLFIMLN